MSEFPGLCSLSILDPGNSSGESTHLYTLLVDARFTKEEGIYRYAHPNFVHAFSQYLGADHYLSLR